MSDMKLESMVCPWSAVARPRRAMRRGARFGALAALGLGAACGSAGAGTQALGGVVTPVGPVSAAVSTAGVDSLGAAVAAAGADAAADAAVLDSLHEGNPAPLDGVPAPVVAGDEITREAVRLFGAEGRSLVEADARAATFDIDVTTFAANRRVLEYLRFFQVDARDRFEIWLSRLGRYEGMIRDRLRRRGLPEDLVYLTLIESGLSNTAVSRARAVGMWQFIAGTGRMYGLTIDPWVDERRDPFRATDAAVDYLSDLVERLGTVYLAAAAYNAGLGRIERGVRRLPGEPPDSLTDHVFFQLSDRRYLRRETRDYVPKLIAAALIAKQPDRYGFGGVQPMAPLVFDELYVPDATGLDVIARLADTTVAALLELNPHFVRGVTPPGRGVTVRVPRGRGVVAAERYAVLPVNDRVTFVDHYVSRGETLSQIARRYRVSQTMVRSANPGLRPQALRIGQRLIIPMSGRIVPQSAWTSPPEATYRRTAGATASGSTHRVQRGESASQIARRYGVSTTALLRANGLTMQSVIHPGDRLRIPR